MRHVIAAGAALGLLALAPVRARAQELSALPAVARLDIPSPARPHPSAVEVPDSVRRRAGYQHWNGAAIGGGAGALVGLVLSLVADRGCADCSSSGHERAVVALTGAGLGSAFGFLVGSTLPRYRWVPLTPAEPPPSP